MELIKGIIERPQKILLYGPEGIGKSTFASHFPAPVFIDTEGSTVRLDVTRAPAPSSWAMLTDQVKYFRDNPHLCKTLVIDTADWAEQLCIAAVCTRAQKSGIEDFGYAKGYVYVAEEFGRLLNILDEVLARGIHIVFTAHAQMRKFEQPDEMNSYDRWEMKLAKKTAAMLREWADMVLFANYETYVVKTENKMDKAKAQGGRRVMYTSHHPCWDAKNRHGLKEKLPFDYAEIASLVKDFTMNPNKQQPNQPAATPQLPPERPVSDPNEAPAVTKPETKTPPPTDWAYGKEWDGIPQALIDLMKSYGSNPLEIQNAVAERGYYPQDMPIKNYDPAFIEGVLIGAWNKVLEIIEKQRGPLPF